MVDVPALGTWFGRARALVVPLALGSLLLVAPGGCKTQCGATDETPVLYADGLVTPTASGQIYMTTPYDGTWLHFPSQRRFILRHHLGTSSYSVDIYLSFHSRPLEKGGLSEPAGNEAIIERLDEHEIVVRNDTCAEFYLLVRLETTDGVDSEGSAGAGAGL